MRATVLCNYYSNHTYRQGLNSNVLRFVAKLDTTRPIDVDRTFIIFFYLSDDTIAVFERPQRNSGKTELLTLNITSC